MSRCLLLVFSFIYLNLHSQTNIFFDTYSESKIESERQKNAVDHYKKNAISTLLKKYKKTDYLYRLDSIRNVNTYYFEITSGSKTEFYYDENYQLDIDYSFDIDLKKWKGLQYNEQFYDTNGLLIKNLTQKFPDTLNNQVENLVPYYQNEYEYNNENQITKKIITIGENIDLGIPNEFVEYLYREDNQPELIKYSGYRVAADSLFTYQKTEYEYNTDNLLTAIVYSTYNHGIDSFLETRKTKFKTNSNREIIEEVKLKFEENIGWVNIDSTIFSFSIDGLLESEKVWVWNLNDGHWNIKSEFIYTYNSLNKLVSQIRFYSYSEKYNSFTNQEKISHRYVGGNLTSTSRKSSFYPFLYDNYDGGSSYTINFDWETNNTLYPKNMSRILNNTHLITSERHTTYTGLGQNNTNPTISYHYSELVTSATGQDQEFELVLFPNPTTNKIQIRTNNNLNFNNVTIFDTSGKKILQKPISKNNAVSLKELTSGIYFIEIRYQNKKHIRKIIKE